MLGQDDLQRSFFDAGLAVEDLLKPDDFYGVLYRLGPKLLSDEDFADCYDGTTGRPSVPPSRMFKLVLLQAFEDLSDRQALERMAFDLRWKAVLDMDVDERAVGQTTLSEFRARVQTHEKMEEAFRRFLEGLVEAEVLGRDEVQLMDSSAIWGRGAVQDTYNLIGGAVRKLLGAAARRRQRSPEELAGEIGLVLTAPEKSGSLKGRAGIDWSKAEDRRAFLNELVEEARRLVHALDSEESEAPEVAEAVALLRRILLQDLRPVPDDEGQQDPEQEPPDDGQGGDDAQAVLELGTEVELRHGVARDRVMSTGDPEMRHGHKSPQRRWDGYKVHVSADADHGFITAIEVTEANAHDSEAAPALIRQHRDYGLEPSAHVGDAAYSKAELRQWAGEEGTEIIAPVPPPARREGCFSKQDFEVDLEVGSVMCPAGQTTHRSFQHSGGGRVFVFDGATCATCSLRERCTARAPETMRKTGKGRSIVCHALEHVLEAAREAQKTARVQGLLAHRWKVEQGIGHLMRRGLRQARYIGRRKTRFQAFTMGLVTNLVRFAGLCEHALGGKTAWNPA